jgi:E1A/CREB-binding protein
MALRLENALYFSANSREEYVDRSTLKQRLQQLAMSMGGAKPRPPGDGQQPGQQHGDAASSSAQGAGGAPGQGQGQGGAGGVPNAEQHRQQVLKQQQQRLLLLRHASKCPHENNKCQVTPHCANMKTLWKHIMSCKDQDCKTAHCVSSRYVLSHYSKCKDAACPVCGPVREAIRRNYDWNQKVARGAQMPQDPRIAQ